MLCRSFLAFTTVALLSTLGCTSDSSVAHGGGRSADAVAAEIVKSIQTSDRNAFMDHLTDAARAGLTADVGFQLDGTDLLSAQIDDAVVSGDSATVLVRGTGQFEALTLRMRREAGAWRLFAVSAEVGGGEMSFNFEEMGSTLDQAASAVADQMASAMSQAWEQSMREQAEREVAKRVATFDAMRPVSRSEFEASWRNTKDFTGVTLSEAVEELVEALGYEFEVGRHAERMQAAVEIDVTGLARLEAIDRLCGGVQLTPVFPSVELRAGGAARFARALALAGAKDNLGTDVVQVVPRRSEYRNAFAGPFMVSIHEVEQQVPHARGQAVLSTEAHGLDAGVLGLLSSHREVVAIDRLESTSGESLLANPNVRYFGGGTHVDQSFSDALHIDLVNLLRDVDRIETLSGQRRVVLPSQVETVVFDAPVTGTTKKAGPLTLTLKQLGESTSIMIEGPEAALKSLAIYGRAQRTDDDGNQPDLQVQYEDTSHWGGEKAQYQLNTKGVPESLSLRLVLDREIVEYDFALTSIPLERHSAQPVALKELAFDAPQPVTLEFQRFHESDNMFPEAELTVTNHSNKPIRTATAKFIYLNAQGKAEGDHPHTIQAPMTMDGPGALVAPAATESNRTTAFFRPDGAKSVRIVLTEVEFMDGTKWSAE